MSDSKSLYVRKPFVAGNWKMNTTCKEAQKLTSALKEHISEIDVRVMIAPPYTALTSVYAIIKSTHLELGAQNVNSETGGAFTGEISCNMLMDVGVNVVIIGHSERRHILGEQDTIISQKVKVVLESGMDIILCCGETLQQKKNGEAKSVVETQLRAALDNVTNSEVSSIVVAYEPVWAIGTGHTATVEDADSMHQHVRSVIADIFTIETSQQLLIQYGGSVKPDNARDFLSAENIDGVLVGGSSLDPDSFSSIVDAAVEYS